MTAALVTLRMISLPFSLGVPLVASGDAAAARAVKKEGTTHTAAHSLRVSIRHSG
jgi:hypothetical protein